MSNRVRYRNIRFTIDHYEWEHIVGLWSLEWTYLIVRGIEVKDGKSHISRLEGYMELTKQEGPERLKATLQGAEIVPRKRKDSAKTVSDSYKEGDDGSTVDYYEAGTLSRQGTRKDLDAKRKLATERGMSAVIRAYGTRWTKMVQKYLEQHEPSRDKKPLVVWLWRGSDEWRWKTMGSVLTNERGVYTRNALEKVWTGYDGHECVIIENLVPGMPSMSELLAMLGPNEYRVETEYGSRQLRARTIIINSELHPVMYCIGNERYIDRLWASIDRTKSQGVSQK